MTFSPLPQELIDAIVDNLAGDLPSLRSCSLTSRTFAASARPHIFRKLEIKPRIPPNWYFGSDTSESPPPSTCPQLLTLLTSSPHHALLVKELCVVVMGAPSDRRGGRHVPWLMAGRSPLSLVLPLLNLKRISLVENAHGGAVGDSYTMNWNRLGRQLKSALADVFSSTTLQSVHLRGIVLESPRQLFSFFSEASSLQELALSRVHFERADPWLVSKPWGPQLRSLLVSDMRSIHSLCQHLINPSIDLDHVSSLTITTTSGWMEKLIQASSHVENLRLVYSEVPPLGFLKPILATHLRSIHFLTSSLFEFIAVFFKSCPHDSHLETITFEQSAESRRSRHEAPEADPSLNAAVNPTLVHLHYLKSVRIKRSVRRGTSPSVAFAAWAAAVQSSLPSLVRRRLLSVQQYGVPDDGVLHGFE
ncbi:hypothetical protein DFH08DRAFT_126336 [Mycena albidolilacea]|uniref:F-box domain-containing protein n=1 Tax=Mycena albidolilacea TaxID=1033008 RepID=A0AAD7A6J7_9AGAR|nr:hypothetical protein DFH08DRAFT_126336 [Mycena albidolilacea]